MSIAVARRQELIDIKLDAVHAAEIAAIGHGKAQVADMTAEVTH